MRRQSDSSDQSGRNSVASNASGRVDSSHSGPDPELVELAEQMNLPVQDLEEFREVFSLVDTDRGGSISIEELGTLMDTLGVKVTPEELEIMVAEIDENGNGEIDFEEFVQVMSRKTSADHSPDEVKSAFKLFAAPEAPDGTISLKDLEDALTVRQPSGVPPPHELVRPSAPTCRASYSYWEFPDNNFVMRTRNGTCLRSTRIYTATDSNSRRALRG